MIKMVKGRISHERVVNDGTYRRCRIKKEKIPRWNMRRNMKDESNFDLEKKVKDKEI